MAATPWTDAVKSSKQLTVFPDPGLSPSWRATFQSALQEFNRLSSVHNLGVTLTPSATPPDTEGEGGANIRFQTASGTASGRALATDFADAFSGTEVHGFTKTFKLQFGQQAPQMVKALIFVPSTPVVDGLKTRGGGRREAGPGVKLFVAMHEFVHAVGGMDNSDHSPEAQPDVFVGLPVASPTVDVGSRPADDKVRVGSPPNLTRFPPITLSGRVVGLIRRVWS